MRANWICKNDIIVRGLTKSKAISIVGTTNIICVLKASIVLGNCRSIILRTPSNNIQHINAYRVCILSKV